MRFLVFKNTSSDTLEIAEDFLEKLKVLDEDSELSICFDDISSEETNELASIQERRKHLEGVMDAVLQLDQINNLPRFLQK